VIKAIIFDFGQTLVDSADGFRSAEKKAKEQIFSDLFPHANEGEWQTFLVEYRQIRKNYHTRSNFSRFSIWQAVYEKFNCGADAEKLTQMETEYWNLVKHETTSFPETISVLERLAKDFKLGIITNTQGQKATGTHRIALFPGVELFFEVIIIAGESGLPAKPDAKPFLLCLQEMGLKPSEAIYVGDDFQKDVYGSDHAGLHAVWIKHDLVKRSWPEPDMHIKFDVITNLNQLVEIAENGLGL
jgi:putative hydrolase of the HAD superfamily